MPPARRPQLRHVPDTGEPIATAPKAHHQQSLPAWLTSRNVAALRLTQRQTDLYFEATVVGAVGTKGRGATEHHVEAGRYIAQSDALASGIPGLRASAACICDLNEQLARGTPHVDINRHGPHTTAQAVSHRVLNQWDENQGGNRGTRTAGFHAHLPIDPGRLPCLFDLQVLLNIR